MNEHDPSFLAGQTLASALRRLRKDLSWSQSRRVIASRRVRVNGTVCVDDARRLGPADHIEVTASPTDALPGQIEIVYRDEDIVVVEKPAGVQSVRRPEERDWSPERKQRQPALLELVAQQLARGTFPKNHRRSGSAPEKLARSRNPPSLRARASRALEPRDVFPVHRLDRDTSGLMIFALSRRAETELVRRFAAHDLERIYRAIVHGRLDAPRTIETWLARDRGDGLRGSLLHPTRAQDAEGRTNAGNRTIAEAREANRAVTHVRPLEQIGTLYTLIECRLETGRTHQIRIHLAELGHRLCGEKTYVTPRPGDAPLVDRSRAPRQALHSWRLEFEHPITRRPMQFESTWPTDLRKWLDALGGPRG